MVNTRFNGVPPWIPVNTLVEESTIRGRVEAGVENDLGVQVVESSPYLA